MGINIATLYRWKDEHCDICEALKKGKAPIDFEVENALLKRALGYDYTETVTEVTVSEKDGETTHQRTYKKHMPPDPTSLIFWLRNRRPGLWRNNRPDPDALALAKKRVELLERRIALLDPDTDSDALKEAREILGEIDSAF